MCNSICHLLNFCCRSACPNTSIAKDITAETAVCNVSSNLDTGKEETVHPAVAFAARMVIHWIAWTGRDDAMRSDLQAIGQGLNRKRGLHLWTSVACPGLGSPAFNSFRNNPYRAPNGAHLPSTRRAKDPQQNYAPTRCTTTLRQQHSSRHRTFHHHHHSLLHHLQHDAQKSNKVSCLLLPKSGRTHH